MSYLAFGDDTTALAKNGRSEVNLLADDGVVFVVGVVGIAKLPVRPELELQELVPELPLVPNVVSQVELPVFLFARHSLRSLDFVLVLE